MWCCCYQDTISNRAKLKNVRIVKRNEMCGDESGEFRSRIIRVVVRVALSSTRDEFMNPTTRDAELIRWKSSGEWSTEKKHKKHLFLKIESSKRWKIIEEIIIFPRRKARKAKQSFPLQHYFESCVRACKAEIMRNWPRVKQQTKDSFIAVLLVWCARHTSHISAIDDRPIQQQKQQQHHQLETLFFLHFLRTSLSQKGNS